MTWTKQKVDIFEDISAVLDPPSKIKKSHSVKLSACFRDLLTEALKAWPYASEHSVYWLSNSEFPKVIFKELNTEKQDPKCCVYFKNKWWRHYLKSITLEKWFSETSEHSLSIAGPTWKNTEFELDWNTGNRGWKKEMLPVQDSKNIVE